jgi:hypothetical protein
MNAADTCSTGHPSSTVEQHTAAHSTAQLHMCGHTASSTAAAHSRCLALQQFHQQLSPQCPTACAPHVLLWLKAQRLDGAPPHPSSGAKRPYQSLCAFSQRTHVPPRQQLSGAHLGCLAVHQVDSSRARLVPAQGSVVLQPVAGAVLLHWQVAHILLGAGCRGRGAGMWVSNQAVRQAGAPAGQSVGQSIVWVSKAGGQGVRKAGRQ